MPRFRQRWQDYLAGSSTPLPLMRTRRSGIAETAMSALCFHSYLLAEMVEIDADELSDLI